MSLLKMSVISYLNDWTECHLKAIRHHWHGNLIALTLPAELRHVNNQQMTISWRTCLLLQ